MLGDEGAVGIVEMKMVRELLGGGIADEVTIVARTVVAEDADGRVLFTRRSGA
jgi:hypothetical protein